MNVEYTGRHYEITPIIRKSVETGLAKIRKILARTSHRRYSKRPSLLA